MVEFAIAMPIVIVLLFAMVDGSRMASAAQAVNTATREATRYASAVGDNGSGIPRFVDCDGIRDAARRSVAVLELTDEQVVITYDKGPGTTPHEICSTGAASPDPDAIESGDRVIVSIEADFESSAPFLSGILPQTLESTDHSTIFKGAE
jgi:hypothetical protein